MKNNFLYFLVFLTVLIAVRPAAAAASGAPVEDRIDAYVTQQMERHKLPGLALALVDGNQIIFMKGYGKADQTGRAITPQTPFLLASVSKPVTALAVMQLVEAGQVELDSPVQHYLPEFRLADPAASGQITVRHLLLHTSGIPVTACDTRKAAQTLADFVAELQTVLPDAPVGARHAYCSGNYNVLGRMIEVVSGQSFGDYIQEHIFTPLDMRHSYTTGEAARQAGISQGYQWIYGLLIPTNHPFNPSQLPSGFLISSAEDMSHFLIAQLDGGRYTTASLLSETSLAAMQSAGTSRESNGSYGLGWVISPLGDVPAVWHDGVHPNFHTMLLIQPDTKRGAILLFNSFGLAASASAYQEIETGVSRLLAGMEPAPSQGMSLGVLYLLIDGVLALILGAALCPLITMRTWYRRLLERRQSGRRSLARPILRSAWEIGFALILLLGVRIFFGMNLGAQSWAELLSVFPDFVVWIWLIALVGIITAVVRLALISKVRMALIDQDLVATTSG